MITKKLIAAIIILLMIIFPAFALTESDTTVLNNSNELLHSVIPVEYGRSSFVSRINDRTQGKREPVGLLLSGGSARAFAHIGVIRYLEEKGITPDYIISNSMGSIVGIMYAAGLSSDQIFEISTSLEISSLFDITFPVAGGIL
ncbi:MAG: patatin-like phospholipase family protein, partial [Sphaerochaetaceae bacterium]|nr:patatin-like phospholipase family protein [Sphaerochaetaceae bacterium]